MIAQAVPVQARHPAEWFFYLLGAFLMLATKWWRWVRAGKAQGKSIKQATVEWFSIDLLEDKVSWAATIGIVWVFGVVYIDRVSFLWTEWITAIPVEESIAFLFGSMMEVIAPNTFKWILNKLPIQT